MGSCLSSESSDSSASPTVKVISADGKLREYASPVTVSQALEVETSPCFICNSDKLFYDSLIPPLHPAQQLQPGQLYFVLPLTRLHYRLTASDMAALAVKASTALTHESKKTGRRGKRIRVSPAIFEVDARVEEGEVDDDCKRFQSKEVRVSRYGSVAKLQRSASRRARLAVRSFKMRLSTIYEGCVLE
ncbi:PREDICTED: uncharacterized protein LOC104606896 [Nelumbo nucifera]|uniref:Uncharacterized protein LOC104606896 n=2 Tax=Nelumbo nucifera TaxID=4432 RepID=A0A1U8B3J1_NELNU|nr:PREDICTED: uncharacterized protein LOC104606896 [Nelumbo nucifera]DAD46438.1 TPA_asm: hypothetical protein HUJ06_016375 [Nelumbo nucifera]